MSQEKVDRYKKEKANRQAIIKAEKRKSRLSVAAVFAVIAALAVWFGISVAGNIQSNHVEYFQSDFTALDDYLSDLSV